MLAKTQLPKIRVLIIDDSRLVRIAASRMFGEEFEVILAVDGADGWGVIQRDPDIQVVFTDLVMPIMDGFELLEIIRTNKNKAISDLPVIVVTGADNPEVAKQKAFALGATDFITKPFDAIQIKARARSYAKFSEATKQLQKNTTLDVTTGLLNSKGLQHQLDKEISFVSRHRASISVMTIEVDHFKDLFINVGRTGAEKIIKKVAEVLTQTMRREDTVARTGVASFSMTMPLSDRQNSLELAERVCQKVEGFKARLDGKRINITVSIGVCVVEQGANCDVDTVLNVADEALIRANKLGRSQFYQLTLDDYQKMLAEENKQTMSIDSLLDKIKNGEDQSVLPCLDAAIERIAPLLMLLSNEQKQRVITYR